MFKLFERIKRRILSKTIEKTVRKKYGYDMSIQFENLDIDKHDKHTNVKIKAEITLDSKDYKRILKLITK